MARLRFNSMWFGRRFAAAITLALALLLIAGKPKSKGPREVQDLNALSMRVHAMDVMYELDLSPDQMRMLKAAAAGAAEDRRRNPATGNDKNDKLGTAFNDFSKALLARQDDQEVAKLRNQLTEAVTADEVHLDDEVVATDAAWAKSAGVCRQFSAGQIAAYLASHADQIADPAERMAGLLTELHDTTNAIEAETEIQETSEEIGRLVAGHDPKKITAVAGQVNSWLKMNRTLSDDQLINQHAALEASARKVIGDVPPMDILSHWMDNETAVLMSNPELPDAIDAVLAARQQ